MKKTVLLAMMALCLPFGSTVAGDFDDITIDAKLIGGQQYEALYARIAQPVN
ncbi:MAG: multiple sugar transport system substrate-binding protein [bacterium]|jgi:multiple sugar transport system substrate-binding protein